ncbi:transmembrane protein, putative (macronuclear) [Tetrahymena thermophila SB210]|uniref:Transmembrane protein, putative n=1 Tax=Tetrahymena thermophila (strain SB210) TaxID=312017 RepID=W7XHC0_TETTS|nr:transmembrane protein, putative [Tetrahymena thermophila SB210]EWS76608.1 transmembrane protein, putative [Tetrahymena thermophila SB210]|eukprot:XP_012650894.1 transmembrane protein, putative [Tetrahymena thermophila SB210]
MFVNNVKKEHILIKHLFNVKNVRMVVLIALHQMNVNLVKVDIIFLLQIKFVINVKKDVQIAIMIKQEHVLNVWIIIHLKTINVNLVQKIVFNATSLVCAFNVMLGIQVNIINVYNVVKIVLFVLKLKINVSNVFKVIIWMQVLRHVLNVRTLNAKSASLQIVTSALVVIKDINQLVTTALIVKELKVAAHIHQGFALSAELLIILVINVHQDIIKIQYLNFVQNALPAVLIAFQTRFVSLVRWDFIFSKTNVYLALLTAQVAIRKLTASSVQMGCISKEIDVHLVLIIVKNAKEVFVLSVFQVIFQMGKLVEFAQKMFALVIQNIFMIKLKYIQIINLF